MVTAERRSSTHSNLAFSRRRGPVAVTRARYGRRVVERSHWVRWHDAYADPTSSLSHRLAAVQRRVGEALTAAPAGPISLISACAGQGRDVVPVVAAHARRDDVRALLVELDPQLADDARQLVAAAGLTSVTVATADAALTDSYAGAVPAQVALWCGVFGNISDEDIKRSIDFLPTLIAPGARVIWTRHSEAPNLVPTIRRWFGEAGFEEVSFDTEPGRSYAVGTHQLVGRAQPFRPGVSLFQFRGDGSAAQF